MRPFRDFSDAGAANLRGVFTDIDDTLTSDGRLTAEAYAALERLQASGLLVVPITGRPAGWCDMIARFWPVDGVVGENGALYFRYDRAARRMIRRYQQPGAVRRENRARLDRLAIHILREVPGSAIAADQAYRESDLAIDFCEDVPRLGRLAIDRIVDLFVAAGATAKVSSIHVNGWIGDYDKLAMTRALLKECFSIDLDAQRDRFVFVGDSPNDGPMFAYFPLAVAVANVRDFIDRLEAAPTYVAEGRSGKGFVEVADGLLRRRPPTAGAAG